MLVLSRKIGEIIVIGDGPGRIEVMITDIDRGKVRLGITALKETPIMRAELLPEEELPDGLPKPTSAIERERR